MGASQPTTTANKSSNILKTGYKNAVNLSSTYGMNLEPALNVNAGYVGSQSNKPLSTFATATNLKKNKKGKNDMVKYGIIAVVIVAIILYIKY